jgi:hypothetical protein
MTVVRLTPNLLARTPNGSTRAVLDGEYDTAVAGQADANGRSPPNRS